MKKVITASVVAVLVIGSSAIGQIDLQYETWDLGLTNDITLSGGTGDASTTQGIGTLSIQNLGINPDGAGDPTASASQGIIAALFEDGDVETGGAEATLGQSLTVVGLGLTVNGTVFYPGQTQRIGDLAGPTVQHEGAQVDGSMTLAKGVGSSAMIKGLNLVGFAMGQHGENTCAEGFQLSLILGGQYSELDGAPQAIGNVETTATAAVNQFQTANNAPLIGP